MNIGFNTDTCAEILRKLGQRKDLEGVKRVHDQMVQNGGTPRDYLLRSLMKAYFSCERVLEAHQVFEGIAKKDVVSWNMLIRGYCGRSEEASELFL